MFIGKNTKNKKAIVISLMTLCTSFTLAGCMRADDGTAAKIAAAIHSCDYANAVAITTDALQNGGNAKELFRLRGIAELGKGDYYEAVVDFLEALSCSNGIIEASDIDTSYYLAVAQYKNGDIEGCESTLSAITDIRPKEDSAYLLRGKVRLAKGDKESAKADFDKAISLAPTKYDYYVQIFEELLGAGYESEGNAYLEKALSAGNKLSDYYKGVLEYYMGSYTDARNDLENARKSKDDEDITLYLGKTYEALGDSGYARTLYEEFIRKGNGGSKIYEELSYLLMNQKDYEGALAVIEAGLGIDSGSGRKGMMFNRVVAYENLFDFEAAKAAMEEYIALYPDDQDAQREQLFLSSR